MAYFDHNATTPLDPRVMEAMLPAFGPGYANASSLHRTGRAARDAVEHARGQVAAMAGAQPGEVIFTTGGTESNNLALRGVLAAAPGALLYGATEHPAVLETGEAIAREGGAAEVIPVDGDGHPDLDWLVGRLAAGDVSLVSVMRANNETGVIIDVPTIADATHAAGAWLHCDATQAAGKLALDMRALGADLLTVSSHKLYGPRGVGALIVRDAVPLRRQMHGGGQELGLRGGTENVPAIVGFGMAAQLAVSELDARTGHMTALRDRLEAGLDAMPGVTRFARTSERLCNTTQFALSGFDGESLLMALDAQGVAVSSGSACASGSTEPSHVLLAMGVAPDVARGAVRVSLGRDNTADEIDAFLATLGQLNPANSRLMRSVGVA